MSGVRPSAVYYVGRSSALGWGSLAMINGAIAEFKGLSPVMWSCISVIGGPFCTFYLVYFVSPPHRTSASPVYAYYPSESQH